jgi:cytoskeletal protein RodZ
MTYLDDSAAAISSADASERPHANALADSRRAMLRARARRIRRSVALFAAALFSAAFLMVYVQLASGHDPALVADARRASTQVTAASSASGTQGKSSSGKSGSSSRDTTSTTGAGASSTKAETSTGSETSTGTSTGGEESTSRSGESTTAGASETATAVTTSQS